MSTCSGTGGHAVGRVDEQRTDGWTCFDDWRRSVVIVPSPFAFESYGPPRTHGVVVALGLQDSPSSRRVLEYLVTR